ncbi:MAG: NUDIX domain-containing protein [Thermogutta sp.]|nr:NUDIX domain-containing protein [Thermogutta sp.]
MVSLHGDQDWQASAGVGPGEIEGASLSLMSHPDQDHCSPNRRGVVAVIRRGRQFLIIRRAAEVAAPGMLCFPGGGIEPGETEEKALVRELLEELGVGGRPRRRLWRRMTPWGVDLAWWLVELDSNRPIVPNPAEVAECLWLTETELEQREDLLESNRRFLAAWRNGEIDLP